MGVEQTDMRIVYLAVLAAGIAFLANQTYRTSFRYGADTRNPYAYSHTVPDHLNLVQRVRDVTALAVNGHQTPIAVVTNPQDAWNKILDTKATLLR